MILVQKSGKNNKTVAFIDLPLVCHSKYHQLNIDTTLSTILQSLHFNTPIEFRVDRNCLIPNDLQL